MGKFRCGKKLPYSVTVTVKATDNDKIESVNIAGKVIAVGTKNAEVSTIVTLSEGPNPIKVQIKNTSGNITKKVMTTTFQKTSSPPAKDTTGDRYGKYIGKMVQLTYATTNLRVAPNGKLLATLKKGYKMRYLGREGVWDKVRVTLWTRGGYKTYPGYIYDPYF
ncbi:hypothetical protein [Carboxydothermus ferrireducens]|uniref:SH3 domain-containing protein n=1 Tax=Carboxydothermus ferrireducens DSM 11255 TaxID=1119529 RepID=A0ABX2R9K9_9THEO|nr:hypothetical protein [Carboxydothermus ferrireducens]NYE57735.1 hypothetical protein [Carboxydothermus ferrireducens DSM 11255]